MFKQSNRLLFKRDECDYDLMYNRFTSCMQVAENLRRLGLTPEILQKIYEETRGENLEGKL